MPDDVFEDLVVLLGKLPQHLLQRVELLLPVIDLCQEGKGSQGAAAAEKRWLAGAPPCRRTPPFYLSEEGRDFWTDCSSRSSVFPKINPGENIPPNPGLLTGTGWRPAVTPRQSISDQKRPRRVPINKEMGPQMGFYGTD